MSGILHSVGGFLGLENGPKAAPGQFGNAGLSALNNYVTNNPDAQATGATTGSNYATQQVQGNPLLSQGLEAMKGQLQTGQGLQSSQMGQLDKLQNQGFNLTQGDRTQYGQEAGNIARQFGQQGNQLANSLASRGLSSSGAAGAAFSGLAGNQNEMLSQAQQSIAQQRYQNTMSQIGQTQNFLGSLNSQNNNAAGQLAGQGAQDIQQQYGRQLSGAQNTQNGMAQASGLQNQANNMQNDYNTKAQDFEQKNKPANFMDFASAGMGQATQAFSGGAAANAANSMGSAAGKGLFG